MSESVYLRSVVLFSVEWTPPLPSFWAAGVHTLSAVRRDSDTFSTRMRKKVTFLNFYKLTFRITYEAIFINVNVRSSIPSADRLGTTTTSIEQK